MNNSIQITHEMLHDMFQEQIVEEAISHIKAFVAKGASLYKAYWHVMNDMKGDMTDASIAKVKAFFSI